MLPIELTAVGDYVATFADAAMAMRHAVHQCTLLSNQADQIKNTYCLRVALLQHLFTEVVPLPLPHNHPHRATRCFWGSQPMRYETQAELMRLLALLGRHYASASLSLRVTRSFDAARMLTMACIATVADVVMRVVACDAPSMLALQYSGTAEGPTHPFGFEMGQFAVEGAFLRFTNPELATAFTQVMDYHAQRRLALRADHVLFGFERSMALGGAEARLLNQLCLSLGYPRSLTERARFLCGEDMLLIDGYPELGSFRDLVFTFKVLLALLADWLSCCRLLLLLTYLLTTN